MVDSVVAGQSVSISDVDTSADDADVVPLVEDRKTLATTTDNL